MLTPFNAMQNAVDIVNTSEHAHNKIAACLFLNDLFTTQTNHRPLLLKNHFAPEVKIGGSSQFLHAETACIFAAKFQTNGASIAVTDPPCPNCAKAICEAGIVHVYIDHKGMAKDFAARRGDDFKKLSLLMFEKAGVNVSIIYRKENRIEPLVTASLSPPPSSSSSITSSERINDTPQTMTIFNWGDDRDIGFYLSQFHEKDSNGIWALARISKAKGVLIYESLTEKLIQNINPDDNHSHPSFPTLQDVNVMQSPLKPSSKYRLPVDPINRLLFHVCRNGWDIVNNELACNLHPSSRAIVNATGYGIGKIYIADNKPDHDSHCHDAAQELIKNDILIINYL